MLQAEQELRDRQTRSPLNADSVYNLYLRAYGDVEFAERAQAQFILSQSRAESLS